MAKQHKNISIIWDFDGTLTPIDSTSQIIDQLFSSQKQFWEEITDISGLKQGQPGWRNILASNAPTWMFVLSQQASKKNIRLDRSYFKKKEISSLVKLYPNVVPFLKAIKNLENTAPFKKHQVKIHHFIVSAGLEAYIQELVPKNLFTCIWGSKYKVRKDKWSSAGGIANIPVFCMDQTMKTRALYEISKGIFLKDSKVQAVNQRVEKSDKWSPIRNFIYIGDGPTDIPCLSLTRSYKGYGIGVYNPSKSKEKANKRLKELSQDRRCDVITKADFSKNSELFNIIQNRCMAILHRYQAEDFHKKN